MPTFKLRKRIQVMQPAMDNDFAPSSERDEKVCEAWADIKAISGNERVIAQQVYGSATYSIVIRRQSIGISPQMVVIANGERFPIASVVEDDGQYLRLLCTREADAVGSQTFR